MPLIAKPLPDVDLLKELLALDPETGALTWKPRPDNWFRSKRALVYFRRWIEGKRADNVYANGYRRVRIWIDGSVDCFGAHRIVWKMVTGRDPIEEIDHIDRNKANNAISNLREATRLQNVRNREIAKRPYPIGIYPRRGRFKVQARINGSVRYLGSFGTVDEARVAISRAKGDGQ